MSDADTTPRRMLTPAQVCELVGAHRMTLQRWITAGHFPKPVKIGPQASRFFEDEVIAWQNSRKPYDET